MAYVEVARLYHLRRRLRDPRCAALVAPDPEARAQQLAEATARLSALTGALPTLDENGDEDAKEPEPR